MKKLSVVLHLAAALVLLLGGPGGTRAALAGSLPNLPVRANTVSTTAGGKIVLSIPAAAFTPFEDGYDFQNDGRYLKHFHNRGGFFDNGWYYAPVQLPQGATVTKLTYYFYDTYTSGSGGGISLQRAHFDLDGYEDLAGLTILNFGGGFGYAYDDTTGTIDNSHYAYWLVLDLPVSRGGNDQQIWNCGVAIEYTPPTTETGIQTISAAAFNPYEDGYDYENHGRYLLTNGGVAGAYGWYLAPVQLPQGAVLTNVTFHWFDANLNKDGEAKLQRTDGAGNFDDLAVMDTTDYGGYGSTPDTMVSSVPIDNSQYAYWLIWDIPVGQVRGCSVTIAYTLPSTQAVTGLLSVSAAPFKPHEDGYDYENDGRYLMHFHNVGGSTTDGWYLAQVNLPQGAAVTRMTLNFYKTYISGHAGELKLQRTRFLQGNYDDLADLDMGGPGKGYESTSDNTIDYATIDNSQYAYWLILDLPVSGAGVNQQIWACDVTIEYSYRTYLPGVLKYH